MLQKLKTLISIFAFSVLSLWLAPSGALAQPDPEEAAAFDLSQSNVIVLNDLPPESNLLVSPATLHFIFKITPYDNQNDKYHSLHLVCYHENTIFAEADKTNDTNEIAFLMPGTGMAPGENGKYGSLILENKANHYLLYSPEPDEPKRVDLIEYDSSANLALVHVSFYAIYGHPDFSGENSRNQEMPLSEFAGRTIYLIAFTDKNLNKKIEKGEMKKITLTFTK